MSYEKTVLITGASKGIGAACARAFAKAGHDVCLTYLSDYEGARVVADECEAMGAKTVIVQGDVALQSDVAAFFRVCDEALGPVTCLINNAGVIGGGTSLEGLTQSALEKTFQTNVFGSIYCTQEAIWRMGLSHGGAGGAIINMSSVAARLGSPGEYVHYAATKGAVETLTIGAGKELGPDGIRVNAIRVGTTNTTMHQKGGNPERPAKIAKLTPLGRVAEPSDIADTALWLASAGARFITGTVVTVAGGFCD